MQESIDEVIEALVSERTGDRLTDLAAALRAMVEVRRRNSVRGALVVQAMRDEGLSWQQIHLRTDVKPTTARRWGNLAEDEPGAISNE